MIGMSQIKQRLFIGIAIGAGVGIVAVLLTLYYTSTVIKSYEDGSNKNYIAQNLTQVIVLNRDVMQGEKIDSSMVTTKSIHKSTQPEKPISSEGYAIGKIVKYNLSKNIPLTEDMISDNIITADVRIQEISQILLPTDVKEKDFVDFRLRMPSGVEYIVMTQKQIQKIVGTTIWLNLSEEELHIINAATVDAYSNEGIVFYAVEYTDPQTQIKINAADTADKAKKYLAERILADVAAGNIPSKEPATTVKTTVTDAAGVVTEKEVVSPEYTEFKDKMAALLLKYSIDYRYYMESCNKIEANYQPSTTIIDHMKANKYIVEQAKNKLSADVRNSMVTKNAIFEEANKEKLAQIIAGAQAAANSQKQMRAGALAAN